MTELSVTEDKEVAGRVTQAIIPIQCPTTALFLGVCYLGKTPAQGCFMDQSSISHAWEVRRPGMSGSRAVLKQHRLKNHIMVGIRQLWAMRNNNAYCTIKIIVS